MRRKKIKEDYIINLTKDILYSFYNRKIEDNLKYLSDDFMWIGAFDFQYTFTKNDFLKVIQSEINSLAFKVMDEEFFILTKDKNTIIICSKLKLLTQLEDKSLVRTHTRLTIVWKYIEDELKIVHIHGSNSQDIPLSIKEQTDYHPNLEFFEYLKKLELTNKNQKISFKDNTGKHKTFIANEILYIEANLQNAILYTKENKIEIYGMLTEHIEKLPEQFYRVHKSYIVNTDIVCDIERYKLTLENQAEIPIGKEKFMDLRDFLTKVQHLDIRKR